MSELAVQELDRRFMHARIARSDNAAAALSGLALPSGDDTASTGDNRNQRCDVVGFQFSFHHEIDMAGGEHAVGIAVAAIARQPDGVFDPVESGARRPERRGGARNSRSVTLVTDRAIVADALAKAVFILGPRAGLRLIDRLPNIEGVIVGAHNEVVVSSGLKGRLVMLAPPTDAP